MPHLKIIICLTIIILMLIGCSKSDDQPSAPLENASAEINTPTDTSSAANNESNQVATAAAVESSPAVAVAMSDEKMARKGKILYLQCRACHTLEADGEHTVGPNLHGLIGSSSGVKEGFTYSEAMTAKNITWSDNTLNEFLEKPSEYIPGTIMAFVGLTKAEDRAAIIQYLNIETQ